MAHFCRSSRGIVTKSLQFQKCFSRSRMMASATAHFSRSRMLPPSIAKPVVNIPQYVPGDPVEKLKIYEIPFRDYFEVGNLFTVKDLFDAQVHYGHTMTTLNEDMKKFILEERMGTLVFDLQKTAECLRDALHFIAQTAFRGGKILFLSRYEQNTLSMGNTVLKCDDEYYNTEVLCRRTFTYSSCFSDINRLPNLIIYIDTPDDVKGHVAVLEANKLSIPTLGVVDTNCFPNYITYPIPGNDHNVEAVRLYCKLFNEAILRGWTQRKEFIKKYKDDID